MDAAAGRRTSGARRCSTRCHRVCPHPAQPNTYLCLSVPLQQVCYDGEKLKGRYTAAKHWHGLMRQVSALGDIVLIVEQVDHQPLAGAVSRHGGA